MEEKINQQSCIEKMKKKEMKRKTISTTFDTTKCGFPQSGFNRANWCVETQNRKYKRIYMDIYKKIHISNGLCALLLP